MTAATSSAEPRKSIACCRRVNGSRSTELVTTSAAILVHGGQASVAGHNPASSWVAVILMGLALGLGATGFLMARGGNPEPYEEIHELFANPSLAIVHLHIACVVLHMLRHRDGFALSMVDGRKQQVDPAQRITSARPAAGLLFIALLAAFAVHLGRNYDVGTQSLSVFGTTLQLGESDAVGKGDDEEEEVEED